MPAQLALNALMSLGRKNNNDSEMAARSRAAIVYVFTGLFIFAAAFAI